MAILVNRETKVLVQGFTGKNGTFHAQQCIEYGTKIVGGVTPGRGGEIHLGRPVFNTMKEAVAESGATASMIFVPAPFVLDSILEAIDAGIEIIVVITEGVPTQDMMIANEYARLHGEPIIIGPNCPGILVPDECKIGIIPGAVGMRGKIGIISRSGTLTYETMAQTTALGLGQSTCLGIGGDPIPGLSQIDALKLFEEDPETEGIILIGEIGGTAEEEAAAFAKEHITKPIVGYIAGVSAPPGKRMGHAGAIISGGKGTAEDKFRAFEAAGIRYTRSLAEIGQTMLAALEERKSR